jgi:hypothetical protein
MAWRRAERQAKTPLGSAPAPVSSAAFGLTILILKVSNSEALCVDGSLPICHVRGELSGHRSRVKFVTDSAKVRDGHDPCLKRRHCLSLKWGSWSLPIQETKRGPQVEGERTLGVRSGEAPSSAPTDHRANTSRIHQYGGNAATTARFHGQARLTTQSPKGPWSQAITLMFRGWRASLGCGPSVAARGAQGIRVCPAASFR